MERARVVVTLSPTAELAAAFSAVLDPLAEVVVLRDAEAGDRRALLASADALLAWSVGGELGDDELASLGSARLLQLLSAGVDHVPFERIPPNVPVASNAGSYSAPMAEHVLALALALARHLPRRHAELAAGVFDRATPNRSLRGSTVVILGYGGIGQASARLFRSLGSHVAAIGRAATPPDEVDEYGSLDDLGAFLPRADVLVIALPLTRATRGLIGSRELSLMKEDAILVNVARAAIVDEDGLYEHLSSHPAFAAGLDVWWQEPRRRDPFTTRLPFLELANVLGSPHNSALTATSLAESARQAAENVARALRDEPVQHLVDRAEYLG
jgi:phosphoglycerate dehydrogenase-like enzyme